MHSMAAKLKLIFRSLMGRNLYEKTFVFLSLFMAVCFIHFDNSIITFAKMGLPLPSFLMKGEGQVNYAKIFVTECYIAMLALLTLGYIGTRRAFGKLKNPMFLLLSFFVALAMIRMAADLRINPINGLRNASFAWYLAIPVFVYLLPISAATLEAFAILVQIIAFAYFTFFNFSFCFGFETKVYWIPYIGCIAPFACGLFIKNRKTAILLFLPISVAFTMALFVGLQRTTLLGMVIWFFLELAWRPKFWRQIVSRMLLFLTLTLLCVGIVRFVNDSNFPFKFGSGFGRLGNPYGNPFVKGEMDKHGLEVFRKQMWIDAWGLFLHKPILGIGFQQQVVYRVYNGTYYPNGGDWSDAVKPPIAGPHNSYLNALTRLGILGALLLVLHAWAFWVLYSRQLYASSNLLFSGMLYAFFNVGLEGPVRSFLLLIAIGAALISLSLEKNKAATEFYNN